MGIKRPKKLKAAKDRAWKAFSQYVRREGSVDGYNTCVTCKRVLHWKELHAGHFVHGLTGVVGDDGEAYIVEENIWPQCAQCNTYNRGNLINYTLHMEDMYGREFIDELRILRKTPQKISIDQWWQIEQEYIEKILELE